jgi:hypothetical protein
MIKAMLLDRAGKEHVTQGVRFYRSEPRLACADMARDPIDLAGGLQDAC